MDELGGGHCICRSLGSRCSGPGDLRSSHLTKEGQEVEDAERR